MAQDVYRKVDYTLRGLIDKVQMGEIALPDLQRPFIWKNSAVRDLFDSLYIGYPVGFFLFWETDGIAAAKTIGTSGKQKEPKLLVVDGQQRLTSLYAVVQGADVVRDNFQKEAIKIAFDPLNEKFEVSNAATAQNPNYIPNISALWEKDADIYDIANDYTENLRQAREVFDDEVKAIRKRLLRVQNIINTQFIALELSSKMDVEGVAEVFVRINSKGKPLQQADFIMTLMSVFWEQGRRDLEGFSRMSKTPSSGAPSAYNHFISPDPDMLLRAGVGLGFRRARLRYVYALLTGRDLKTGQKDDDRRQQQFDILKEAQGHALNLQNWHDYLKCLRDAGYRSGKMLSGELNIMYSYVIYLIGRVRYKIDKQQLARVISKWFFMAALTGRYSSSSESTMEGDLARFRKIDDGSEFLAELERLCAEQLTEDFWSINLPAGLANSSASNAGMMAYFASLSLLKAKALYSDRYVSDLLDPAIHSPRSAVERHHLFPKAYLEKRKFKQSERNQTANYAILEYSTNGAISDRPPNEYDREFKQKFSKSDVIKMYHWHALPDGWYDLEYEDFLIKRREQMAAIVKEGYELLGRISLSDRTIKSVVLEEIVSGEGDGREFKSTLRKNLHTGQNDPKMELAVLKTISGFLNANGGQLYIGIADDGSPVGIAEDNFPNEDKMLLHLTNIINDRIGLTHNLYIDFEIEDLHGKSILKVDCQKSKSAVWLKDGNDQRFFIRTGASTSELKGADIQKYIEKRF